MRHIPLWTTKEIIIATSGKSTGNWQAERVVINSRDVKKDDLFIALKGENHDAHRFVAQALESGASGAIVEYFPADIDSNDERLILVSDTMKALEKLAITARERLSGKVIGVTGSVGKTSTKEALKMAFESLGKTHATSGNYNNHIGVPLTLANMPADTDFAIIEMGMSNAGEINNLTLFSRPNIAIITAIEAAHIEFFANVEEIADAKLEIIDGIQSNGVLLLPADSLYYSYLYDKAQNNMHKDFNIRSFGKSNIADYRLDNYNINKNGSNGEINIGTCDKHINFKTKAIGEHWGGIVASVIGAVDALGKNINLAIKSLEKFIEPVGRGRMTLVKLPSSDDYINLIDDSYNASPTSMIAAFDKLNIIGKYSKKRTIALLGDMLELGDDSQDMHISLVDNIVIAEIDKIYVVGERMRQMYDKLPKHRQGKAYGSADEMINDISNILQNNDVVLVKGSHGSGMYKIAEKINS